MLDALVAPWTWGDWMWRGMLAVNLVAVACALLGVFLYLRRLSLLADALAHVALPGIVAAFMFSGSLEPGAMLLGAALMGLGASFAIETLARQPHVRPDAAIGIVFTALFAAGVIALTSFVEDAHIDVHCLVFGDVLGVSDRSLTLLLAVVPAVVLALAVFYRWLAVSSFDPLLARSLGVPVVAVHYGLMAAVSTTAVAGFEAVGAILVIALMVLPAATAHLFTKHLTHMLALAAAHAILSAVAGMYLSIWLNASAAGAIVVVGGALHALARLFAPGHGLTALWQRRLPSVSA